MREVWYAWEAYSLNSYRQFYGNRQILRKSRLLLLHLRYLKLRKHLLNTYAKLSFQDPSRFVFLDGVEVAESTLQVDLPNYRQFWLVSVLAEPDKNLLPRVQNTDTGSTQRSVSCSRGDFVVLKPWKELFTQRNLGPAMNQSFMSTAIFLI